MPRNTVAAPAVRNTRRLKAKKLAASLGAIRGTDKNGQIMRKQHHVQRSTCCYSFKKKNQAAFHPKKYSLSVTLLLHYIKDRGHNDFVFSRTISKGDSYVKTKNTL
jgi:hypothetical protein